MKSKMFKTYKDLKKGDKLFGMDSVTNEIIIATFDGIEQCPNPDIQLYKVYIGDKKYNSVLPIYDGEIGKSQCLEFRSENMRDPHEFLLTSIDELSRYTKRQLDYHMSFVERYEKQIESIKSYKNKK